MADRPPARLDIVQVRLVGRPEHVDRVLHAITAALPAADASPHRPSRKNPAHVLVYVEVSPE
ncbi:hypothetical protein CLV63_1132 [Murinocardiopsis flavida]|uniref:Uncharacterized protein n=1 Tax=Murinocardiopsis flavida TaxID=645275 RepID=A0A2P8DF57_9ACTN|nr:hypothetical protein [Murinocardiopsis flavida]PSK95840.1 hypothetical protein CLV63_1132 [Murinocardiopsis flavida]